MRPSDQIPRDEMGTSPSPVSSDGPTIVLAPLFPGALVLNLDTHCGLRPGVVSEARHSDCRCHDGSSYLDVCTF
jgi:hypothetical protein